MTSSEKRRPIAICSLLVECENFFASISFRYASRFLGPFPGYATLLPYGQSHIYSTQNFKSNLILYRKDILELQIISLGEDMVTLEGVDKLRRDSHLVTDFWKAPSST